MSIERVDLSRCPQSPGVNVAQVEDMKNVNPGLLLLKADS